MIRAIVYDDSQSILIAGLISILASRLELEIVGSFTDESSLTLLSDRSPNLLLLEQLSNADLWWLWQWLETVDFEVTGILFSDLLTSKEIDEYIDLGFKGFLPRQVNLAEITTTIKTVTTGLIVFHPDLFLKNDNPAIVPLEPQVNFTPREMEVFQLLGIGRDNKAIAQTLHISKHTVKFHISSILSKLDVSSRTEAVASGLRQGIIRL